MRFFAIDTETTGLYPHMHGLCEIAVVSFDSDPRTNTFAIVDHFVSDVSVGNRVIDLKALEVNKFTQERLAGAPPAIEVAKVLSSFLVKNWISAGKVAAYPPCVFHNAPFDVGFLPQIARYFENTELSKHFLRRTLDTISFGFALHCDMKSLKELVGIYAPDYTLGWNQHSALGDAIATAIVFHRMMTKIYENGEDAYKYSNL